MLVLDYIQNNLLHVCIFGTRKAPTRKSAIRMIPNQKIPTKENSHPE